MKLLIGVTGSVATVKLPILLDKLEGAVEEIRIITTDSAKSFTDFSKLQYKVYTDSDDWTVRLLKVELNVFTS